MHADQAATLELTPAPGAAPAKPAEAPALPNPWDEVRAARPDVVLVRIVDEAHRVQFWIALARSAKNLDAGAEVYDGSTIVLPRGRRPDEERDAIIAAHDASWHQQKQCPSTSPTTGAQA